MSISALMPHLMLAPIALPLFTGALMLLMREEQQRLKLALNVLSTALGLLVALALLQWSHQPGASSSMGVYLAANWQAPFGIVLALDRLSAMMLVLTAIVISFAMTALFLVVLLASRGMSGTDHVDGSSARDVQEMP